MWPQPLRLTKQSILSGRQKTINLIHGRHRHILIILSLIVSVVLAFPFSQVSAAGMPHQVTNVRDRAFSVTWVTNGAETGYVNYGISPGNLNITVYDDRGQSTVDDTHHITVTGLNPGTTYYYEIVSGGVSFNNNGTPYQMTTGPTLLFTMPEMISGQVYKASGTVGEGTIIYVSIGASQVLSSLVNEQGAWALDIAPIRAADYQAYHTYENDDSISLDARGGSAGTATVATTVAIAKGGTLETTLAGGTEQDTSDDITDTGSDSNGDHLSGLATQSCGIQWWVWPIIGLAAAGALGFFLKRFVFYHD